MTCENSQTLSESFSLMINIKAIQKYSSIFIFHLSRSFYIGRRLRNFLQVRPTNNHVISLDHYFSRSPMNSGYSSRTFSKEIFDKNQVVLDLYCNREMSINYLELIFESL